MKRTSWFDKVRYAHRTTDILDKLVGIIVVLSFLIVIWNLWARYHPIDLIQVNSPVKLDRREYKIGDTIKGKFIGQVFTDNVPTVSRSIVCDDHTFNLTDAKATGGRRILGVEGSEGNLVPIVELSNEFLTAGDFVPAENCFVKFVNTYTIKVPLTQDRIERVRYFSDRFDIVKP